MRADAPSILLTEGSSLTSREFVTCLAPGGHRIEVMDPDRLCLSRFSRRVRTTHRCPSSAADPRGYVAKLLEIVRRRRIDVVLPTHEQAWLLAVARPPLPSWTSLAVADAAAFERVQSKLAFARLLDELTLPQPRWLPVASAADADGLPFPFWLKAPYGTAGQGVRPIDGPGALDAALRELGADETELMAQAPACGRYAQVQGLFDHGRLVAVHTSEQAAVGVGGSAAARISVDHPAPRAHIAAIGDRLAWHGGLTLDYLHRDGSPEYLECNPRTVEPGNAAASGVNIPQLQVSLSRGGRLDGPPRTGRAGVRTQGAVAILLGDASRGASRRELLQGIERALMRRGPDAGAAEQLTPLLRDPPSMLPAAVIAARLLLSPGRAASIAGRAVASYSVDPAAVREMAAAADAGS